MEVVLPNPAVALVTFLAILLLTVTLFWPGRGIASRIARLIPLTERVRIEDSLKHMFDAEYHGTPCTVESLAGALEVSRARASRLIARLKASGLLELSSMRAIPTLVLTDQGREYAVRILRTHRLWEQYLAERTGVRPEEWHTLAEVREHTLSAEDADSLAASMGYPPFDPHGDPIPTAEGHLPPTVGVALTSFPPGRAARIVHLEDQPPEVYRRLIESGISPDMHIQLLESSSDTVRFIADGHEHELEPVAAANVTVVPTRESDVSTDVSRKLSDLRVGEAGTVVGIVPACRGVQRRRLLDLGVVPGTSITARLMSPLGEPTAYDIRGAIIALRREQADAIQIADPDTPIAKVS